MSNLEVTIKDDNGIDCIIENMLTFQKHLKKFNKKDPIFRWNDAVFTVDDSFRGKVEELVEGLSDYLFLHILETTQVPTPSIIP